MFRIVRSVAGKHAAVPKGAMPAALLLAALCICATAVPAGAKLSEGDKALPFKATNFLTQEEVDLETHLGKQVVLLDFGSIYCSSCMVTVPNLIKLRKRYGEEDLAVFNIYLDIYNPQRVIKFFRGFATDIRLGLVIDEKLAISREYGIDTLPTTIIIDRSGTIQRRIVGYTEEDEKEIDRIIEELVQETPAPDTFAGVEEGNISLFIPESFSKTKLNDVTVVGFISGEGVKDVSMKLNNLPEKLTQSKENVFHFRTNLSLAMNLIEVKGQVGEGKVKSQSVVLFRETPLRDDIRSELPEYRFHRDEENKPCGKCHEMEVSLQDKSSLQQSAVCNKCHKDLSQSIFTHGPITVGGCLPCHDYQSFPNKYQLRSMGTDLCYTCHETVKEVVSQASYLHGPTAAGMCIVCHDPHGSTEKFLLRRKADRLCMSCHQNFLQEFSKPVIHRPVEEGNCTGCHDAHGSEDSKMLVLPRQELCAKCHDLSGMTHLHKVGMGPSKGAFAPGVPLDEQGRTNCYSCHLYHSADEPKLWRGEKKDCGIGCHTAGATETE